VQRDRKHNNVRVGNSIGCPPGLGARRKYFGDERDVIRIA
jgi:hypothetical protein